MKTLIRRSFLAFFLLLNVAHSKPEIINQNIIKQSAFDKISQITEELYSKTGVSIVAHFVEKVENGIPEYENNVTSNISRPYVFLIFVAKDEKVDMVISDELKSIVVKNDVLSPFPGGPIIPILAAQDKNGLDAKYSAAALNGVADIADSIAKSRNVILESNIGSDSKTFMQILRAVFYGTIVVALFIYGYMIYRRRSQK
jgi:AAA+ ATPase superfamily predicted ATPase